MFVLLSGAVVVHAIGGDDLDGGVEALDFVEPGIDLRQKLVERRAHHHLGGARFRDGAYVGKTTCQRWSQRDQPHR